jgi:DNA-binding transcriptional MerR regulator
MRPIHSPAMRYSIGQLGRIFGVTARTLRFYEERGLLEPDREGAARVYTRRDYRRMQVIAMARRAGLSLNQAQELLNLYDPIDQGRNQLARSLDHLRERAAHLDEQRASLAQAIADMETRLQSLPVMTPVEQRPGARKSADAGAGVAREL